MSAANAMAGTAPVSSSSTAGPQGQLAPSESTLVAPFVSVQQQTATLLDRLYDYFQANTQQYPALANAIPTALDAVALYGGGLYPQALAQTMIIYQWIDSQRGWLPPP